MRIELILIGTIKYEIISCQIFHLSDIKFIFIIWVITPISRQTPSGCLEQKVKLQTHPCYQKIKKGNS